MPEMGDDSNLKGSMWCYINNAFGVFRVNIIVADVLNLWLVVGIDKGHPLFFVLLLYRAD